MKYGIIYGHPQAFVRKLRKIWIGKEAKKSKAKTKNNVKAFVIDEAHLIVEFYVLFCFRTFRNLVRFQGVEITGLEVLCKDLTPGPTV